MPLKKIFWFVTLLSILFIIVYLFGINTMPIVLSLFVVDIVVLHVWNDFEKKSIKKNFEDILKFSEKLVENIKSYRPTGYIASGIDIERHKEEIRSEFKKSTDKLAKKAIQIENDLNKTKKDFMFLLSELNKKIKELEENKEIEVRF